MGATTYWMTPKSDYTSNCIHHFGSGGRSTHGRTSSGSRRRTSDSTRFWSLRTAGGTRVETRRNGRSTRRPESPGYTRTSNVNAKERIELLNLESWTNCIQPKIGSFSAVSTPIFAINGSFCSIFQALHLYPHATPDFCLFFTPSHRFSWKIAHFFNISRNFLTFRRIWMNFDRNFAELQRSWGDRYRKCSFF